MFNVQHCTCHPHETPLLLFPKIERRKKTLLQLVFVFVLVFVFIFRVLVLFVFVRFFVFVFYLLFVFVFYKVENGTLLQED